MPAALQPKRDDGMMPMQEKDAGDLFFYIAKS